MCQREICFPVHLFSLCFDLGRGVQVVHTFLKLMLDLEMNCVIVIRLASNINNNGKQSIPFVIYCD